MEELKYTLILYYIPEDKDDLEIPNAFAIKKPLSEVRMNDIRSCFPIEGDYHFRFKYKLNNQIVWMDISNPNNKLPIFENTIFIKATRKSWKTPNIPIMRDQPQSFNQPDQNPRKSKDLLSSFEEEPKKIPAKNSPLLQLETPPDQKKGKDDFDLLFTK